MALPQTIGKYRVTKLLGSGGFGAVYLAEDPKLSGNVAIKVFAICNADYYDLSKEIPSTTSLNAAKDRDIALRERFVREASLLRQLSTNPNIVDVYDFDEMADGTPYFVMPYLEHSLVDDIGKDALTTEALNDLPNTLRPRKLPVLRVIEILTEILFGLAEVHKADLIHRDIKPANILFDVNGRAQLCDFGVAKTPDSQHSETGVVMGSRNYMSPEQRESGKHVTAGSDVYSVGVLAYRMLTGTLPIGPCDDPIVYCPDMGASFNALVLAALSPQREKRPEDASDFLQRLKSAMKDRTASDGSIANGVEGDDSVTEMGPAPSSVRGELKKLEQTIEDYLLEAGGIDKEQYKQLQMLAAIENLNDSALLHLIARVEKRLESRIKPMQVFAAMVDDVLVQARGSIMDESLDVLKKAGKKAGLSVKSIERIFNKQQALYRSLGKGKRPANASIAMVSIIVMACLCAVLLWWLLGEREKSKENVVSPESQKSLQNIEEKPEKQIRLKPTSLKNDSQYSEPHTLQEQETESAVSVTTMLSIPGGQFVMGSTGFSNVEIPAHTVTIQPFQLGETEVTWAQYQGCIDSGACSNNAYDQGWGRANRPVINVSWNDVQRYIQWLNNKTGQRFRLASEAEWEYAARAVVGKSGREVENSSNQNYSWGDNIGENNANCDGCGSQWDDQKTAPVASFSANSIGLYDMHGNVWEWVQDCWHDNYNGAPTNGNAWEVELQDSAKLQRAFKMQGAPTIQGECRRRVLRGGSWNNVRGYLRSAYRSADSAESTYFNFGFRLAHD